MNRALLPLVLTLTSTLAACGSGEPAAPGPDAAPQVEAAPQAEAGATLLGSVGSADDPEAFEITLTTEDGEPVDVLAAGDYTLVVSDPAQIHNFHLTGSGLDVATGVEDQLPRRRREVAEIVADGVQYRRGGSRTDRPSGAFGLPADEAQSVLVPGQFSAVVDGRTCPAHPIDQRLVARAATVGHDEHEVAVPGLDGRSHRLGEVFRGLVRPLNDHELTLGEQGKAEYLGEVAGV